ncbi:MAG: hypothetical protein KAT74_08975, partial [Candidatus Cloacimonetes bacterium]|nr:hypothetical protein [Candidatus Cloacimonadota bacterium]
TSNPGGGWGYNSLYGYADFSADSLLFESEFDWTYRTFLFMDHLNYEDIDRVNKDMIVNDNGQVAFFGSFGDSLFCLYSDDWGENFTLFKQEWLYYLYYYEQVGPWNAHVFEGYLTLSNDGTHYNGVFSEDNSKILWMTGTNMNSLENIEQGYYIPAFFYPKIFSFDIETGIFDFYDMDIQGVDPADDQPMIPIDLNEDGEVDDWDYIPLSMCSWFYNSDQGYQDAFYHENNFKMSANNNWIVAAWHDCKKLRHAYFEEEGFEGWYQQPEIAISISDDCGETWSEIRYINANPNDAVIDLVNHYDGNYAPEFEDMLPVNITLGEKLEILSNEPGNYHAQLHFAFFDDNDYGSAAGPCGNSGQLNGGKLRYAALDIEFQEPWQEVWNYSDDNTVAPGIAHLEQNFPNPFNPSGAGRSPETTIQYNLKVPADVKINIYNIKGQKVKQLFSNSASQLSAGQHSVTWNGTDDNNKPVSSGLYF